MTLYAWIDENGRWRVSHFPPTDDSAVLMIGLDSDCDGVDAQFFDRVTMEDIPVEVRRA